MTKYRIGTREDLLKLQAAADLAAGLPRRPDFVVSKLGRDKDPNFGVSRTLAEPEKHPDVDLWAYPESALVEAQAVAKGAAKTDLGEELAKLTELPKDWVDAKAARADVLMAIEAEPVKDVEPEKDAEPAIVGNETLELKP